MGPTISVTDHVSLIVLEGTPADLGFVARVFSALGSANVNADLISQSPAKGELAALSFSVPDEDFDSVLRIINGLRSTTPQMKFYVSNGNNKIAVIWEAMRNTPGVAARVFQAVADLKADIRLISTSETEISFIVPEADKNACKTALESAFQE